MRRSVVWVVPGLLLVLGLWPQSAVDAERSRVDGPASGAAQGPVEPTAEPAGATPAPRSEAPAEETADPAPAFRFEPGEPATRAARRVLRILRRVERRVEETRYQHRTSVAEWKGLYAWDCSGMVTWVLERAARGARNRILSVRPVARDYYEIIENSPRRTSYKGWSKIHHVENLQPGDLFAWKRPKHWPRRNTGHVGFVIARPIRLHHGAYVVRIADATSVPHQDDTRSPDGPGGFGKGNLLFTVDDEGRPVAYGWYGSDSSGVVPTHVTFGRVHY